MTADARRGDLASRIPLLTHEEALILQTTIWYEASYETGLKAGMKLLIDAYALRFPGIKRVEREYFHAANSAGDARRHAYLERACRLGLEFYIRLPESIPDSGLATLEDRSAIEMLLGLPLSVTLGAINPRSIVHRALMANPGAGLPHDALHIYSRNLEVPSGGGVGTARAIAKAYGVFANGGRELGLRPQTLALLAAPAVPAAQGFHDEFMDADAQFSLGFMKSNPGWCFGSAQACGSPGAGGSLGYADPTTGFGYACVTNRKSTHIEGDPRDIALRKALNSIVPL